MKKPTFSKLILIVTFLIFGLESVAQNYVPFTPRFNQDLKGDIILIGNNILGPSNDAFNDNSVFNHLVDMRYIDIDGDASTFSSTSADLNIPNPNCYRIKYAGLYWGAVSSGDAPITNVKFKGPTGGYNDVVGTVIYDAGGVATGNTFPYSCYADVTDIVTNLSNDLGTYTVGNVSSAEGETGSFEPFNGTGYSAGWSLFVVYEDPTLPGKSITSFDGFSAISASVNLDVPISGFRTIPAPAPVRANFAFAALEGDKPILNDRLMLNGIALSTADRPVNNFFNSSVTQLNAMPVNNRVPNSTNTLGFDTGVMAIPNPGNTVIANDATSATVRLESTGDVYFQYFFSFAVEIIEPNIVLTKIVEDDLGVNIGGQNVTFGQPLNYVIGFQNTGNDHATNLIIRDILPINIIFNYPTDLVLPPGVSVVSYNATTREIIFSVDNSYVEQGDPVSEIRIEATVVETCNELSDACSNIINNQAYATYQGFLNPNFTISDDPSYSSNTGCLLSPQATNFLVDIDDCIFSQEVVLCGASVQLTAANGYDAYSWSNNPSGSPVIGTTQTITVTSVGTYYVHNIAAAPCQDIDQEFTVTTFGSNSTNPVIPYADEVVVCPNDGKLLPNIYLCGANDSRFIQSNISDASSITWEKLNEGSCAPVSNTDCANENDTCTWSQVGTGPDFLANTSGQFRLTINYQGGCFSQFYFNVYQNLLSPTVTATDIICTTPGQITVGGVPSGYEYSIDNSNYQSSNVFTVTTPGIYTAYIRQVGVATNPCVFTVPDVQIRARDFTVSTIITQPLCNGDKGSIRLAANDVRPQYFFSLYNGATLVNDVGPITANNYTFSNLNPGTYTATVSTEDGCTYTEDVIIIEPALLTATSALTIPLTCTDGEITVYPVGGTPPYFYFVNSTTDFQTVPEIVVTAPGVYNITVVDANNCTATTSITVDNTPAPVYTITSTDISCAAATSSGTITVNVSNSNGNSLLYSIDGGVTFVNSSVFTGLNVGDYDVVVQYSTGTSECQSDPQTISIVADEAATGTATLTAPYTCTTNGTITVSGVSGGNAPYTYSIDGVNFQTGTTFTNVTNGTYTVTIKDANDCTNITNEVNVASLNPPTDLMFSNSAVTCPSNTSTITITGTTGGTGTLEYQIIAPSSAATAYQSSTSFSGLAPGTYTFQVKDANDCIYSESYTIAPLQGVSVVGQHLNDVSCVGASDGSIQFTVSGSSGFTYTINGGTITTGTSPITLTGLSANTYTITITDTTTNCEATATLTVNEPTNALAITTTVSQITCIDNGSVVINTTGGWGGNTYSITLPDGTVIPPQTSNTFVNLTQDGTYTATAIDALGCTVSSTFDLALPTNIVATVATTSDLCYDTTNGASLEVTVSDGQSPFEYSINGGSFQSNNTFTNLVPGNYTVTVRDASGCTVDLTAQTIASQLIVSTVLTEDLDCTAAPDAIITGTISGGYTPYTYAVSINGGAFTSLGTTGTPFSYSTSNAGNYQFEITDAEGCTSLSGITTINPISFPALSLVAQSQPILCNGDTNGAIDVTIDQTVGTSPFLINVTNTTTGVDYGTQTTSLPAGNYTVTLTDAKSCTATETITINEPDAIVVNYHADDITCEAGGLSQGAIIVDNVSGGTAPYDYYLTGSNGYSASELNASGTTPVTFDVDFGLYHINVVDTNGCSILIQDVLVASPPTDLDIVINTSVDCSTGGEAVVSIGSTLTGSGPFFFSIYPGDTSSPPPSGSWIPEDSFESQTATFTGLTPGVTYTFIVYDNSSNCSYYEQATTSIPTNSTLTVSAVSSNNITCTGSADGNVSFTINSIYGTSTDVTYEIFDSLTLASVSTQGTDVVPANGSLTVTNEGPLPSGNYYVLISETSGANSGCGVITAPFNITESAIPLSLTVSVDQNANCNSNSGVISAIAHDGTSPYQYQITTTSTAPVATDPSWAGASTFNVDAGSYYVHVIDAYGCIVSTPVQVVPMDPSPVMSAVFNNQCTAVEGAFEIDVDLTSAGTSPYQFSVDGGAFQTRVPPFTITNLTSGIHTIEVKDVNGCGNTVSITIESPLGLNAAITTLPSCTDDDGQITVTGSGGSGTYTYAISPNPASISLSGNVFSGVPSGTYDVTITDTATSCSKTVAITLDSATPVNFTTSVTNVTCNGDTNGVITVNLPSSNNNPVYTYEITAPILVSAQNSNVFTGLPAGTYTVQVNSGRGCFATAPVTIGEPTLLEISGTATDFACSADNSVNSSVLTLSENGGTAPYTYSIDGTNYFTSDSFTIIDNGSVQTITISVKDANNCVASDTVTINPLPTLTAAAVAIATPIDCNDTGSISISVTGGSGNFTYQMLPNGTAQASNTFVITAPGDYYFQVNDVDTGCTIATAPFTVAPFNTIQATATATSAVTCFGDSNGTFELNINGYTGDYSYEIINTSGVSVRGPVNANTSTNPQTITGIPAGNYNVVVSETTTPFCTTNTNVFTIASPATPLTLTATETSNVSCDNNVGTITAIANGGWGSFEYELTGAATVGFSTNGTFTNLSAGVYTINVRDAEGCIATETVTLTEPTPITATFTPSTTLLNCFGDANATITVSNVTGGQGSNYTYTLNTLTPTASTSGPQNSPVFGGLGAGTYSVSINDGLNCSLSSLELTIAQPTAIQASLVKSTSQTCLNQATLTLSASGGTGPYTYSDSMTFGTVLGSFISSTSFAVPVGTYMYYVKDANGCIATVSNEITIDTLPPLVLNLTLTNATINCAGDNTGVIVATAQGGLGNYIYILQDNAGNTIPATQDSPGVFTQLIAGTYFVRVDSGDCDNTSSPITITQPAAPLEADLVVTDVSCFGGNNGSVVINATGGTGIIKYAISPQLNQFFDTNTFDELGPGTYDIIVQDELGCYLTFNFTISEPTPLIVTIDPLSLFEALCYSDGDSEFSIEVSGGTAPYSVSLDNYDGTYTTGTLSQTQFDFIGLSSGSHIVYVRDSLGCESQGEIFFDSVRIEAELDVDYTCVDNAANNIVTVTVDDSLTDLSELDYSLNGATYQASNVFNNVIPGTGHYIDIRHSNGCIVRTESFDITQVDPITLVLNEGELNEIIAVATGGSGIYEFTLNGESYGSTNAFFVTESGQYEIIVTDSNGCTAVASIYIEYIDICLPNYFTPNGDGVQDGWAPGCSSNYQNLVFSIFDRYGRKVATLNQGQTWDGKYKGAELPTGDYWFVVNLNNPTDDREFVGHFTLYR